MQMGPLGVHELAAQVPDQAAGQSPEVALDAAVVLVQDHLELNGLLREHGRQLGRRTALVHP